MAAVSLGIGFFELLILLFGAPGLGSLGAPQPLDPVLAAVAPQECLWYSASSGIGPADPASANHTEQLFAEPQVHRFVDEVEEQIMAAVRRAGGASREQRVLMAEIPKLARALMTRPIAMSIEDVQPGPDKSVLAEAAFVLNAGDQREEVAAALTELLGLAAQHGVETTVESKGGADWSRVMLPPQAPPVRFRWKDSYFLIAVGDATADGLVARMNGQPPAWLTEARGEHPVDRELKFGYLNVAGVLERVRPLVEQENPEVWPVLERLGLTSVTSIHGVVGFDAVGCTSMAHLVTNGERPGLLAFLPHGPLAIEDLAIVPKDAMLAAAARLNAAEAVDQAVALISSFEPAAQEEFESRLEHFEAKVGVNVRRDILASLGEAWVAYLPGGDLMSSWLNSAAAVRVTQANRLRIAVNRLVETARAQMAQDDADVTIVTRSLGDNTIYTLQFTRDPIPWAPTWCVSDDWLVFGIMPQAVQAAVDRRADESLAAAPAAVEALKVDVPPAALFYQDTPALVRSLYPFVQLGVTMISGPLRQQGIEIDPTALPSPDAIIRHLRPSVSVMGHGDDGFHFTSHGTLPAGGSAVTAAPLLAAMLVPAVQGARQAALEAQEMNHMKQIALACLNFESATGNLPTDVYDADGKPLLSWRVRILPYMEENMLYRQFHLDEPWDSEHNRQFLAQVPVAYTSPTAPLPPGRTRFVGFKGKDGMFPGDEKLGLRDITDGTSATVFFVAASPEAAVDWSRPDDIDFDPGQPFAGVAQPSGQFLAAFLDGSVRRLSLGLGEQIMKSLVTRAGGEVIEYDMLNAPPAPWLYNGPAAPAVLMAPVQVVPVPGVDVEVQPDLEVGREPRPEDVPAVDLPEPGR